MKSVTTQILFLFLLLKCSTVIAQVGQTGSYIFEAEILKIDTVQLSKTTGGLPDKLTMARIVGFKIVKHLCGSKKNISSFLLIDLAKGEHLCDYDFKMHKTYHVKAHISRYNSQEIAKKYRHWFYKLDCMDLPVEVMK